MRFTAAERLSLAAAILLPCENVMYDVSNELSCWYVNVCLVRIDNYDDMMYVVHIGTLAQAYTWDIANESLNCDE